MTDEPAGPDPLTFLFSSSSDLPSSYFQGYAFSGSDLVVGSRGAAAFRETHGRFVAPGEDGCYVTVMPGEHGPEIGVDHAGLMKLFCYSVDGVWCVSNSLTRMAEHLRALGVTLRPNPAQLVALRLPTTFVEQVSTPATIFADIRLIPLGRKLLLSAAGPRELPVSPSTDHDTPAESLQRFLGVWRSRMSALMDDPRVRVTADLSGGLDSRVVFALAASAAEGKRLDDALELISGRSSAQRADLDVARQIASRYGASVNRPVSAPASPPYTAEESFAAWRDLSLGVYLPVYMPKVRLSPWHANLSGLGGESHRPFYPEKLPRAFVDGLRSDAPADLVEGWRTSVAALLEGWDTADAATPPLIRHYREFRARFHGGLFAQTKINVVPLGSRLMDAVTRGSTMDRTIYFEIMEQSLPGLMDIPFDVPEKAPNAAERRQLRRLPPAPPAEPGRVYAGDAIVDASASDGHGLTVLELLARDFTESATPAVRDLLGSRIVDDATERMEAAVTTGSLGHARRASNISRVITAALAMGPGRPPAA